MECKSMCWWCSSYIRFILDTPTHDVLKASEHIYSNIYVNFPYINIVYFITCRQRIRCYLLLCLPWLLFMWGGGGVRPSRFWSTSLTLHLVNSSITPTGSVHKSRGDSVVRMWVQLKRWCVSYVCCRGGIVVMDVIWCRLWYNYDLMKGDLFVLSWANVRRVRWGSLSSTLLMCGEGVRSILLFPLVVRCLETTDVCIWCMFVFMSVVVNVWGKFVV